MIMPPYDNKHHRPSDASNGERMEWRYEYDAHERIVRAVDPAGRVTRYRYDSDAGGALRRVQANPPEGPQVSWELERGRVITMTDAAGLVRYTYDQLRRVVRVARANSPDIRLAYDAARRVSEVRVGESYRLARRYDYLGRLVAVDGPAGIVRYEYQTGLAEVRRLLPNGVATFVRAGADGRLSNVTHGYFARPEDRRYSVLLSHDYRYGPDGRIAGIIEKSRAAEITRRFHYDCMGRLSQAAASDRGPYHYEYDTLSNRTGATSPGGNAQKCAFDWAGRLTSVDGARVSYDACGNITGLTLNGVERAYRYYPDGHLARATAGRRTVGYLYDGLGRLLARESAAGTTTYTIDPLSRSWHPLEIVEPDGVRTQVIWDGEAPLAMVRDGDAHWLLCDHLGSVRLVTDMRGSIVGELAYDPFGATCDARSRTAADLGFTGLLHDREAGVVLTDARAYVPELGLFLQPDPQKRTPSAAPEDCAPYSYCGGDPVNYVDRAGKAQSPAEPQGNAVEQMWLNSRQILASWSAQNLTNAGGTGVAAGLTATAFDLLGGLPFLPGEPVAYGQRVAGLLWSTGSLLSAPVGLMVDSASAASHSITAAFAPPAIAASERLQGAQSLLSAALSLNTARTLSNAAGYLEAHFGAIVLPILSGETWAAHEAYQTYQSFAQLVRISQASRSVEAIHAAFNYAVDAYSLRQDLPAAGSSMSHVPSYFGGVNLAGASQALEQLGVIKGARVDGNGNIILVCEDSEQVALPPMRMDDLVTVFRSVYLNGEGPTVTIDPDPSDPERAPMQIKHSAATAATYVGWVLYECDRIMKTYSTGVDNNTSAPVATTAPEFEQMQQTMFFGSRPGLFGRSRQRWERFWIVPAQVDRFPGARKELTLFDVPLKVNTQQMKWQGRQLVDDHSAASSAGARAFSEWFRLHYDAIAAEQCLVPPPGSGVLEAVPVFAELQRIALITAIAEKLRDDGVPMPVWMKDYPVRRVEFEGTTPVLRVEKREGARVGIMVGGVNISADPATVRDLTSDGTAVAPRLREGTARAESLERACAHWPVSPPPFSVRTVEAGGRSYRLFAMPGAQTQALNGLRLEETDVVVLVPGGSDIRLTRSFNSYFGPDGPWGRGWALDLPRLDGVRILKSRSGDHMVYASGYDLSTPLNRVNARFNDVRPVQERDGITLQVPERPGPFLGLAECRPAFLANETTHAVFLRSGERWHFSRNGELVAVQSGPQTTIYQRGSGGEPTRIVALVAGVAVAQIGLEYEAGRMSRAAPAYLDGTACSAHQVAYRYDEDRRLAGVSTSAGEAGYEYDDGLVSAVTRQEGSVNGNRTRRRSFIYARAGELLSETVDGQVITHSLAVTSDGCESISVAPSGRSSARYDERFRLVEAATTDGVRVHRKYDADGSAVTELSSPEGRSLTIVDSADLRSRALMVEGVSAIRTEYDDGGHLTRLYEGKQLALTQRWSRDGQMVAAETPANLLRCEYDENALLAATVATPPNPGKVRNEWTRVRWNRRGDPVELSDCSGLKVTLAYDASGAPVSAAWQARDGQAVTSLTRDDRGRIMKTADPSGETSYDYDGEHMSHVEVKRGSVRATLDLEAGNLRRICGFDGGVTEFRYYAAGQSAGLLSDIDCANGLHIEHAYGGEGQCVVATAGGRRRVEVVHDPTAGAVAYAWEQVLE